MLHKHIKNTKIYNKKYYKYSMHNVQMLHIIHHKWLIIWVIFTSQISQQSRSIKYLSIFLMLI